MSQTLDSEASAPSPPTWGEASPGDQYHLVAQRDDDGTWIASDIAAAAIGIGATLPEALTMWLEVAEGALRDYRDENNSEGPPYLTAHMKGVLSWLEEALDGGVRDG